MALAYVTLVLDLFNAQGSPVSGGNSVFTPSTPLTDIADQMVIAAQQVTVPFTGSMPPTVQLLATDNGNPQPNGWTWGVSFTSKGAPSPFSFYLPAGPATFSMSDSSETVTWTAGGGLMSLPVGTGVRLSGGSLPGGFSAGTTYYVVASSGLTVQLATTPGGSAISASSDGSGSLTVVQRNLSSVAPVTVSIPSAVQYLQQPAGTAAEGDVIAATGPGAWEWTELTAATVGALPVTGGTVQGELSPTVTTLAFASTVPVNAALGNVFALVMTGPCTLASPTGGSDGQVIRLRVTSNGHTLSYGDAYQFGSVGEPSLSSSGMDILAFEYVASLSEWAFLGGGSQAFA